VHRVRRVVAVHDDLSRRERAPPRHSHERLLLRRLIEALQQRPAHPAGLPRGRSTGQAAVVAALDHAKLAESPGGPAEMVPGQHHVRMNMYIAQVRNGTLDVIESLGAVDPHEHLQTLA
jgi:hypothetical protein